MTVTTSTQLSTFNVIKSILQTSTVLNRKFTSGKYYDYEPSLNSSSFNNYPYILIRLPTATDNQEFLGDTTKGKDFVVEIDLVVEHFAKEKILSYSNALLTTLENANSTFQESGYELTNLDLTQDPQPTLINGKLVFIVTFQLNMYGEVR